MWKILVVEDDESSRKLLIKTLKGKAFCLEATTGREAIDLYNLSIREKAKYDLILLDIMMPDMDGIEVLQTIREKEERGHIDKKKRIPVIMVTVKSEKQAVLEACKKGCDDYIVKPIDTDIIVEKIEKILKRRSQIT